jgi:Xaa-Pro aminopeptidase
MNEKWYQWENLTVAPYCRELIDVSILSPDMRQYIDDFHKKCLSKLTPFLKTDPRAMEYVRRAC